MSHIKELSTSVLIFERTHQTKTCFSGSFIREEKRTVSQGLPLYKVFCLLRDPSLDDFDFGYYTVFPIQLKLNGNLAEVAKKARKIQTSITNLDFASEPKSLQPRSQISMNPQVV